MLPSYLAGLSCTIMLLFLCTVVLVTLAYDLELTFFFLSCRLVCIDDIEQRPGRNWPVSSEAPSTRYIHM